MRFLRAHRDHAIGERYVIVDMIGRFVMAALVMAATLDEMGWRGWLFVLAAGASSLVSVYAQRSQSNPWMSFIAGLSWATCALWLAAHYIFDKANSDSFGPVALSALTVLAAEVLHVLAVVDTYDIDEDRRIW